jgi:hypothetical protein
VFVAKRDADCCFGRPVDLGPELLIGPFGFLFSLWGLGPAGRLASVPDAAGRLAPYLGGEDWFLLGGLFSQFEFPRGWLEGLARSGLGDCMVVTTCSRSHSGHLPG